MKRVFYITLLIIFCLASTSLAKDRVTVTTRTLNGTTTVTKTYEYDINKSKTKHTPAYNKKFGENDRRCDRYYRYDEDRKRGGSSSIFGKGVKHRNHRRD